MAIARRPAHRTRITQVPSVPGIQDARLRSFLESMKQAIEVGEGVRGDPLDTKLTVRDLADIGVLDVQGGSLGLGDSVANTPDPNYGGIGEDGYPIVKVPPPVQNFTATGLFTRVVLSWSLPRYSNHDRVDVFRATVDDFGQAVKVGSSTGAMYSDQVGGGWTGYYWVRNVSTSGTDGPVTGSAEASTPTDPDYMIEVLQDRLDENTLVQALRDRIDLVDGPETLTGSVAQRLESVESELQSQIDVLDSQLAEIQQVPEFDEDEDYAVDDLVKYNGGLYRAIVSMTAPSPLPTDTDSWEKIGDYASLGDAVAAHAASLESHDTRITENEDDISAQATSISQLETGVTDLEQDVATRATQSELNQAISDEESARTTAISNLEADLQDEIDKKASITYVDTAVSDEESARATAISNLETDLQGEIDTKAEITYVDTAVSDEESARTTAINNLETELQGEIDAKAAITYVDDAIADEESARSQSISQLQAEVDDNTAAVATKAEASVVTDLEDEVVSIKAEYSVRVDANGSIAGFGLIAGGGDPSTFAVVADQFAIAAPDGSNSAPFFHLTSDQTVNGVSLPAGTYFDSAFIGTAQIGDAQIGEIGVDKITGDTATFVNANIEDGSITNAKIGNYIQSDNWPSGGWSLNKSGSFTLKSGNTGARMEHTPNRIDVFDSNGRLRVRIGDL